MGSAGFSSKEVRKSGRLGRSQAFVWSPWDENPFPLASWGLLDTLFPRWASLCSSLQWHFHKTLSLWFQAGLCVADRTLIDFQRFLLLLLLFFSAATTSAVRTTGVRRLLPLPLTTAATARATTPAVPSPPTIVAVLDTEAPNAQAGQHSYLQAKGPS